MVNSRAVKREKKTENLFLQSDNIFYYRKAGLLTSLALSGRGSGKLIWTPLYTHTIIVIRENTFLGNRPDEVLRRAW